METKIIKIETNPKSCWRSVRFFDMEGYTIVLLFKRNFRDKDFNKHMPFADVATVVYHEIIKKNKNTSPEKIKWFECEIPFSSTDYVSFREKEYNKFKNNMFWDTYAGKQEDSAWIELEESVKREIINGKLHYENLSDNQKVLHLDKKAEKYWKSDNGILQTKLSFKSISKFIGKMIHIVILLITIALAYITAKFE